MDIPKNNGVIIFPKPQTVKPKVNIHPPKVPEFTGFEYIPGSTEGNLEDIIKAAKGGKDKTKKEEKTKGNSKTDEVNKSKNTPKQEGEPNTIEIQRDANGKITKYTEYGPDGKLIKEVRITGKSHGEIPRPNVKEPNYNINPNTGDKFQNGYKVRPAEPWEIPLEK